MDIVWLQRDYGVYVVNLFDTFHAACVLEMSRKSLAFLLQHYCKIDVDKEYQLADWRIRCCKALVGSLTIYHVMFL